MHDLLPQSRGFPPLERASPEGLLAVGGDLSAERLLEAYSLGIFPWFNPGQPILWWSPDPRAVLYPEQLRISRSLRKSIRNRGYEFSMDRAFDQVIRACAERRRGDTGDSWITPDMIRAYGRLHRLGISHSVEVWSGEQLVGGLYGVAVGEVFFGESMFARATDASKCALVALAGRMIEHGQGLIDCQIESAHLFSLGARTISRAEFSAILRAGPGPGKSGERWTFEPSHVEQFL